MATTNMKYDATIHEDAYNILKKKGFEGDYKLKPRYRKTKHRSKKVVNGISALGRFIIKKPHWYEVVGSVSHISTPDGIKRISEGDVIKLDLFNSKSIQGCIECLYFSYASNIPKQYFLYKQDIESTLHLSIRNKSKIYDLDKIVNLSVIKHKDNEGVPIYIDDYRPVTYGLL